MYYYFSFPSPPFVTRSKVTFLTGFDFPIERNLVTCFSPIPPFLISFVCILGLFGMRALRTAFLLVVVVMMVTVMLMMMMVLSMLHQSVSLRLTLMAN